MRIFKIYRVTIDIAATTETTAEVEADRMVDSGPYSEALYGSAIVSFREQPRGDSVFADDGLLEEAERR